MAASRSISRPWPEYFSLPALAASGPGAVLHLRAGAVVLGFGPTEWRAGLPCRAISPVPEAVVFLGPIDASVCAVRLVFAGEACALGTGENPSDLDSVVGATVPPLVPPLCEPWGALRLYFQGRELPCTRVPMEAAAGASAGTACWAVAAPLPPVEAVPRPVWARLDLRHAATVLVPDADGLPCLCGPALHRVEFLAAMPC